MKYNRYIENLHPISPFLKQVLDNTETENLEWGDTDGGCSITCPESDMHYLMDSGSEFYIVENYYILSAFQHMMYIREMTMAMIKRIKPILPRLVIDTIISYL